MILYSNIKPKLVLWFHIIIYSISISLKIKKSNLYSLKIWITNNKSKHFSEIEYWEIISMLLNLSCFWTRKYPSGITSIFVRWNNLKLLFNNTLHSKSRRPIVLSLWDKWQEALFKFQVPKASPILSKSRYYL